MAAGGLAAVATLLLSGGGGVGGAGSSRTDAAGMAGALPDRVGGGAPTRIGPGEDDASGAPAPAPDPSEAEEPDGEAPGGTAPDATAPDGQAPDGQGHRFTGWAGPGCAAGEYREDGRFERGGAGWYTVASGGFTGGGCDGRFSAVPMSGSPTEDRRSTATWSWHLGDGYRVCALTVFVPSVTGDGNDRDVAGDPSVYRVLSDPDDADSAYTGFAVRQTQHRGSPVEVGDYPVKGDTFAVRLIDRGRDWGAADRVGAHHAAAQMRVACR